MGRVYKAWQPKLQRFVAVKTCNLAESEEQGIDPGRLEDEALTIARLSHPNIVTLFDVYRDDIAIYLIMELLEGQPLSRLLSQKVPKQKLGALTDVVETIHGRTIKSEWICEIGAAVARALEYGHSRGILHRDIKPANIFVTQDRHVKLLDFSIAKSESATGRTATGTVFGTVAYMSPEQILNRELDGRTDLYALGCTLYHMATGQPPFSDPNDITVCMKHVNEKAESPYELNPGLHRPLGEVIMRCLAKKPGDRFASAGELAEALSTIQRAGDADLVLLPSGKIMQAGLPTPVPEEDTPEPEDDSAPEIEPIPEVEFHWSASDRPATIPEEEPAEEKPEEKAEERTDKSDDGLDPIFKRNLIPTDEEEKEPESEETPKTPVPSPESEPESEPKETLADSVAGYSSSSSAVMTGSVSSGVTDFPTSGDADSDSGYGSAEDSAFRNAAKRRRALEEMAAEAEESNGLDGFPTLSMPGSGSGSSSGSSSTSAPFSSSMPEAIFPTEMRAAEKEDNRVMRYLIIVAVVVIAFLVTATVVSVMTLTNNQDGDSSGEEIAQGNSTQLPGPQPTPTPEPARPTPTPTPPPTPLPLEPTPTLAPTYNVFKVPLSDKLVLNMVEIPAGKVLMGSQLSEKGRGDDEGPLTAVNLTQPFYVSESEITLAEWRHVMGGGLGDEPNLDHPVTGVSWNEAQQFCGILSRETGITFRLPTEAQWEYVCRAGRQSPFTYGPIISSEVVNFDGTKSYPGAASSTYRGITVPVKSFPPNAWGLYDIHGNVWELTRDYYAPRLPGGNLEDWTGPPSGSYRVIRGGGYKSSAAACRCASRMQIQPDQQEADVGFRVVVEL